MTLYAIVYNLKINSVDPLQKSGCLIRAYDKQNNLLRNT